MKIAATLPSNGPNHSYEDTEFLPLREPPVRFTGIGPYKGFEFARICVTRWAYCYEVNVGGVLYLHVFKRRENPRFGTISYPRPEAFGVWAWCYRRLDEALNKLNLIGHE